MRSVLSVRSLPVSNDDKKVFGIYLIVITIAIACVLMNWLLRGGLPVDTTVTERMVFILQNRAVWTASWMVWMLAAIGLLVFCFILESALTTACLTARIGLSLVCLGIVPDLMAEVIYAFVMPQVLTQSISSELFQLLEIVAVLLTGFLGNGLYNLGGLLLTLAAIRQGIVQSWVALWGLFAWLCGLGLSAVVALQWMSIAELLTALSMVLSTSWMLIVAHRVIKQ